MGTDACPPGVEGKCEVKGGAVCCAVVQYRGDLEGQSTALCTHALDSTLPAWRRSCINAVPSAPWHDFPGISRACAGWEVGLAGPVHATAASHAAVVLADVTSGLERQQVPVPRQLDCSQGCSLCLFVGPGLTHCQVALSGTIQRWAGMHTMREELERCWERQGIEIPVHARTSVLTASALRCSCYRRCVS